MFRGKQVIVLGAAKSGISSAQVLVECGAEVVLTDITPLHQMPEADRIALQNMNIRLVTGSHPVALLDGADLVVKNPGISPEIEFLREARARGIKWISELELAWLVTRAEVVAITGTNGKTTTTALTGEIFAGGSRPAAVGGNIGVPLTGISFGKGPEWVLVAETSSFQLEDCYELHPRVAVYTNITPDHLDRHKTMDKYIAAKQRLVRNQTPDDYVIINLDDPLLTGLDFGRGQRIGYSLEPNGKADCYIEDAWFCWRGERVARWILSGFPVPIICKTPWPPLLPPWSWGLSPKRSGRACRALPGLSTGWNMSVNTGRLSSITIPRPLIPNPP